MGEIKGFNMDPLDMEICGVCVVCGGTIKLSKDEQAAAYRGHIDIRSCDECKKAIAWAKRKMEERKDD